MWAPTNQFSSNLGAVTWCSRNSLFCYPHICQSSLDEPILFQPEMFPAFHLYCVCTYTYGPNVNKYLTEEVYEGRGGPLLTTQM